MNNVMQKVVANTAYGGIKIVSHRELPIALPKVCAPREQLLHLFDQCLGKKYISLQAPAGYGKTTSVLLWLKKLGCTSAWLTLDQYDNVPFLFYRSLCRSLLGVSQQDHGAAQLLGSRAFDASPVESTIEFLSMLSWRKGKFMLILDDLHTITNEAVIKSLPYVLKRLPSSANVLTLGRIPLPEPMRILIGNDKITFIGSSELAFAPEEIRRYYAGCGLYISKQEAGRIHSDTGGWVSILDAMALSDRLKLPQEKHKLPYEEFFIKNLWHNLNKASQNFLMQTSLVDSFTAELGQLLTDNPNCLEILDLLMRGNINLSQAGQEYRYHSLLLKFLRQKSAENAIDLPTGYKLATTYYLDQNEVMTARRYAVKSGDPQTISEALQGIAKSRRLSLDEYIEQAKAIEQEQLPDAVCRQVPAFYLQKMYLAYLTGNQLYFTYYWDQIYSLLPVIANNLPEFYERILSAVPLDNRISFKQLVSYLQTMPPVAKRNEIDQVKAIALQMPFLHRSARDFYELTDATLREAVKTEALQPLLGSDCEIMFLGIEAGLAMEQNKLDEAQKALFEAESLLNEKVSFDLGWAIYIMLAEIALLKNNKRAYERYKYLAKEYFVSRGALYYNKNFIAYATRMQLWENDKDAAKNWLDHYFAGNAEFSSLYKTYQNITTARAYIVLEENQKALEALHKIRTLGEAFDRPLDIAEADVLTAMILWSRGQKKEARDRLHKLLITLQPYGFMRVIANEGRAVLPILAAVLRKQAKEKDTDEGLDRFTKAVYLAAYEQSKRFLSLTHDLELAAVKLSPRQNLVLELLAQGHKNSAIVAITGLSLNTIRTHTKIVYQKLAVTNVLDAVTKAKQLGLIS